MIRIARSTFPEAGRTEFRAVNSRYPRFPSRIGRNSPPFSLHSHLMTFEESRRRISLHSPSWIRKWDGFWDRSVTLAMPNDTFVVYLGDNGYMLGQHGRFEKHCFYEPAVRIPLIVRWPGEIAASRRVFDLVEMIDILPTVLHLMRLPLPPGLHGIDLEPLLRNHPGAHARTVVFSEYLENEEAMVRSARYKLIVGTGRRLRQDGYQTRKPLPLPGPYQRLYDLDEDPNETNNKSGDPRLHSIENELLEQMFERLVSTRQGLLPIPPGLSRLETIRWCLVPRDKIEISDLKNDAIKSAP